MQHDRERLMNANGDWLAVPRLDLRCLLSFEFPKRRKRRSSCNPPPPQVDPTQTVPLAERDMVEACHVQEGGAGSTATRPRAVHFGAERSGATRSAPGRTGCQLDLVALPSCGTCWFAPNICSCCHGGWLRAAPAKALGARCRACACRSRRRRASRMARTAVPKGAIVPR